MPALEYSLWRVLEKQENLEAYRAREGATSPEQFDAELDRMQQRGGR